MQADIWAEVLALRANLESLRAELAGLQASLQQLGSEVRTLDQARLGDGPAKQLEMLRAVVPEGRPFTCAEVVDLCGEEMFGTARMLGRYLAMLEEHGFAQRVSREVEGTVWALC